jgi:hypothetical protein
MGQEIPSVVLSSFFGRNCSLAPYVDGIVTKKSILVKHFFRNFFLKNFNNGSLVCGLWSFVFSLFHRKEVISQVSSLLSVVCFNEGR